LRSHRIYHTGTVVAIRPSLNIDINRNASTFERPKHLLSFIQRMAKNPRFAGHPGTGSPSLAEGYFDFSLQIPPLFSCPISEIEECVSI
jgi:hypothetical protein